MSLERAHTEIGPEVLDRTWQGLLKKAKHTKTGCILCHLKPHGKAKYIRVNVHDTAEERKTKGLPPGQAKVAVMLHHLAYYQRKKTNSTTWLGLKDDNDISHLCFNTKCMNPDHLFEEDHLTSLSRIFCHYKQVKCGCTDVRCKHHLPPCLPMNLGNN